MNKNQNGFGAIEALLILVTVGIIGFTGWFVWHSNNKASNDLKSSSSSAKFEKKKKSPVDPTADWTPYTSTAGKFSLKYPKSWSTATNPELCSNTAETGVFLLGANKDSVGKCATDASGQMTITWRTDRQLCGDLNSDAWVQDSKQSVSVGGVSATKIEATAKEVQGTGSPAGTKTVQYCAVANNITYIASYMQLSGYPDVLSDFSTMVTKTLKFD